MRLCKILKLFLGAIKIQLNSAPTQGTNNFYLFHTDLHYCHIDNEEKLFIFLGTAEFLLLLADFLYCRVHYCGI